MPAKTYASFLKRAAAFSADAFIIFAIVNIITIVLAEGSLLVTNLSYLKLYLKDTSQYSSVAFFASVFMYYVLFLTLLKGQTPGRFFVGVRVVGISGKNVNFIKVVARFFASIPSFLFFGLGVFWVLFDGKNQAWQDKIANTCVVNKKVNVLAKIFGYTLAILFWCIFLYFYSTTTIAGVSKYFNKAQKVSPLRVESFAVKTTIDDSNNYFKRIRQETDLKKAEELSYKNIEEIELALQKYPKNALLWKYLGDATAWNNSIAGKNDDVTYAYQKAYELNPKNYVYALDLANAYLLTNEYESAIIYYNESLIINGSNNPIAYFGLGKAYSALGNTSEVKKNMTEAIKQFGYDNADGKYNDAIQQANLYIEGKLIYGRC